MEPLWEEHKHIIMTLASFLAGLLLLWLVFLRGYADEAARLEEEFSRGKNERERYCHPSRGISVDLLNNNFSSLNRRIEEEFRRQSDRLHYRGFPSPLIPPEYENQPQVYVRNIREETQQLLDSTLKASDQVVVAPEAATFGLNIPHQYTESREQDEEWLRQLNIVRRAIHLLHKVAVSTDARGVRIQHLKSLTLLRPDKPKRTGPEPRFIVEYPVEIEMMISHEGLMKLLSLCSTPEEFHVVQNLIIDSGPDTRRVLVYEREDKTAMRRERWFGHLLKVNLRLATMCVVKEEAKAGEGKQPAPSTAPRRPIAH